MPDYFISEHADQLVNHWYWRPGWRPGRQFYTWHLTFEGQDDVRRLVTQYQDALTDVPGLDMVPLPWLHVTMQGVGFVDAVSESEVRAIVAAARARLAKIPPQTLTFHKPTIRPQAIALCPDPTEAVHTIRDAIRHAIADRWSEAGGTGSRGRLQTSSQHGARKYRPPIKPSCQSHFARSSKTSHGNY
ncbi:2'-5' RNA ligase family protein [Lentzea tibetensis]|uniref:2'-5' RNA ligase family protein n=1 Tax=Lentzea tibetensis TaxID=2591470 RepID=UPI0038B36268